MIVGLVNFPESRLGKHVRHFLVNPVYRQLLTLRIAAVKFNFDLMRKIHIEFDLDGLHAEMLMALSRAINKHSESALVKELICAILEEDACDNEESRPN